jgi:hypothetical protein
MLIDDENSIWGSSFWGWDESIHEKPMLSSWHEGHFYIGCIVETNQKLHTKYLPLWAVGRLTVAKIRPKVAEGPKALGDAGPRLVFDHPERKWAGGKIWGGYV